MALGGITISISALLAKFTQRGEEGAVYWLDNSINAGARSLTPILGAAVALWFDLRATFVATGLFFFLAGLLAVEGFPQIHFNHKD